MNQNRISKIDDLLAYLSTSIRPKIAKFDNIC